MNKRFLTPDEMEERKSQEGGWELDSEDSLLTTFSPDGEIIEQKIEVDGEIMNEQIDQRYKEWRHSLSTVMTCNQCHDMRFILSNDEGHEPDLRKCDDCHANKRDGYFTSDDQAKAYVLKFVNHFSDYRGEQ